MTFNILLIGNGAWAQIYKSTIQNSFPNISLIIANRSNWKSLIDNNPDGIIVCTPPQTHIEITAYALDKSIPVMCEKPLSLSLKEAEALKQYDTNKLLINHIHLFSKRYQEIKKQFTAQQNIHISDTGPRVEGKHNITDLWDYGPHSIAISLDLAQQYPNQIICRKHNGIIDRTYSIILTFDNFKSRIMVGYTSDRIMNLSIDNSEPKYYGTAYIKNDRSLTNAIQVFVDIIQGKKDYRSGLDLSLNILKILEECDKSLGI